MQHHENHSDKKPYARKTNTALIRLPGSPFWNVFKRFGRDEAIALFISVVGTTVASFFTASIIILAFVGPIIEKVGFFPAHIYEAVKLYRSTSAAERKSFLKYVLKAIKGGSVSLVEDIMVHDPIYILLFLWLSLYSGIPVWLIVAVSFVVAVAIVAALEVGLTEVRYTLFKKQILRAGFGIDSYREARFFISSGRQAEVIIKKLETGLGLKVSERLEYHDIYFENRLPQFSGRTPVVRLRRRTLCSHGYKKAERLARMLSTGNMQTVQVVYIRPQEENTKTLDQFRFFSTRKDKLFWFINADTMPNSIGEISDQKIRRLLRVEKEKTRVSFRRTIMFDGTKTLYASIDTPLDGNREGCIIEFKIRTNPALLLAAMRFVMMEFPVTHTTYTKPELALF